MIEIWISDSRADIVIMKFDDEPYYYLTSYSKLKDFHSNKKNSNKRIKMTGERLYRSDCFINSFTNNPATFMTPNYKWICKKFDFIYWHNLWKLIKETKI